MNRQAPRMLHEAYHGPRHGQSPLAGHLRVARRRLDRVAVPALAVVLLAVCVGWLLGPWRIGRDAGPAPVPAPPPSWAPAEATPPDFALDTTLFSAESTRREVRLHTLGGRLDILRFGAPDSPLGFARLAVYRPGGEAREPGTFFLDLARQAGDEGFALVRSSIPEPQESRFGTIETSDAVLGAEGREASCIAWRAVAGEAPVRLFGWLCAADGRAPDRLALACFIDRLQLAGGDQALRNWFAQTQARHDPQCLPPRPAELLDPSSAGAPARLAPPAGQAAVSKARQDLSSKRRVDSTSSLGRTKRRSSYLY